MERLLLVSMFQNVTGLLKEIEPDLEGKTVTYIPTASRVERLGFLARMSRWVLRGMGLRVDAVDVSTAPYEAMRRAFEGNDLVFIVGGNTFYLLQELRKSGADKLLCEAVRVLARDGSARPGTRPARFRRAQPRRLLPGAP